MGIKGITPRADDSSQSRSNLGRGIGLDRMGSLECCEFDGKGKSDSDHLIANLTEFVVTIAGMRIGIHELFNPYIFITDSSDRPGLRT